MSRQDANAAFARTSFLYGGNAAYIDDLYARYEADPQAVDAQWRAFFESLKDDARDVVQNADGPSWARAGLAAAAARRPRRGARRRLGRGRQGGRRQDAGQGAGEGRRAHRRPRPAGDPRFGARPDADPRLPHARPSPRQSRSARPRAAQGPRGARSPQLRLRRGRLDRPIFLDHVLGLEFATLREMLAILQRTYCGTLGVEFMHISDPAAEGLDPGAHRGPRQGDHLHPRGQARDPQQADRGRGLREVLRRQVHRHQALRPRRRRVDDPGAGADHQARRRARREGDRRSAWRIAAGSTCSPR